MLTPLAGRIRDIQFETFLPGEDRLVLGTVIFKNSTDVFQVRHREDHHDEEEHSNEPVGQVECDP
jgi:hypothetical protein